MRIEDYPPQELLSEAGRSYVEETLKRSEGLQGVEAFYGPDPYQGLLAFPAENPNGTVVVFMYGGGWTNGYKESMAFYSRPFNAAGATFVSLGYRLAPKHVFPAGWLDAAKGVAWVYHNIARFGGDPNKLFVAGHSAGGHYASLLAVRGDWQDALELPRDVIRGALPISGAYYFGRTSGLKMRPRFLGPEHLQNEVHASPITYLHQTPPPFLLANADGDFPHLLTQADVFEVALRESGADVTRMTVAYTDHFSVCYASGEVGSSWSDEAISWMQKKIAESQGLRKAYQDQSSLLGD